MAGSLQGRRTHPIWDTPSLVMAVLVTAIHAVPLRPPLKRSRNVAAWMAVTSTAMTDVG